jgi:hypothetical protein
MVCQSDWLPITIPTIGRSLDKIITQRFADLHYLKPSCRQNRWYFSSEITNLIFCKSHNNRECCVNFFFREHIHLQNIEIFYNDGLGYNRLHSWQAA